MLLFLIAKDSSYQTTKTYIKPGHTRAFSDVCSTTLTYNCVLLFLNILINIFLKKTYRKVASTHQELDFLTHILDISAYSSRLASLVKNLGTWYH